MRTKNLPNNIWIISHYSGAPSFWPRLPEYNLAKTLLSSGFNVTIFSSSAVHNTERNFIKNRDLYKYREIDGVNFIFIKTRLYKSRLNRVLNIIDFYRNFKKVYKIFRKPQLIVSVIPHLLNSILGIKVSKFYKVPHIVYTLDLWPLSIVEYAKYSEYNIIIQYLYKLEKKIYLNADHLVFTWEGAYDYIIDRKMNDKITISKFSYINIGVDISQFNYDKLHFIKYDEYFPNDKFIVMYCGSIRQANNIDNIVLCAEELNKTVYRNKILFIIYGDGPDRKILEEKCKKLCLSNIEFRGVLEKKYIPYVLTKSNLNILNLLPSKTQKYGNSSNKLFEYLLAGNPVIANIEEGKYPIISKYKCGIVLKKNSVCDYVNSILNFYNMSDQEYKMYRQNALKTAQLFDTSLINQEWIKIISDLIT